MFIPFFSLQHRQLSSSAAGKTRGSCASDQERPESGKLVTIDLSDSTLTFGSVIVYAGGAYAITFIAVG